VTLRIGGFVNWIEQLIDIDDVTPIDSAGGVDTYVYRNIGRARTAGLDLGSTFRATPSLRAEVGYSYLWTRDDTADRPLEGRPPHTVLAAVRADLPWSIELSLRYRMVTDAFIDVGLRSPGFQTIDARIARPLWPSSQLYVGVKNALGAQKDPERIGDHRPIEGRIIYLGLTAELPWEDES
jgi:outer membrane receptor for ferrienterochelin and colicins